MLAVTIMAARWTVLRLAGPFTGPGRLGIGCIALGLLLVAEFGLVLRLRGLSVKEYLAVAVVEPDTGQAVSLDRAAAPIKTAVIYCTPCRGGHTLQCAGINSGRRPIWLHRSVQRCFRRVSGYGHVFITSG
jgi:hypothetical protein